METMKIRKTTTNAIPAYNQAYQENFEEDKIPDIINVANGTYILVDPFQTGVKASISQLKANNNEVGAYISIGTGEDWRADYSELQPYLVSTAWGNGQENIL